MPKTSPFEQVHRQLGANFAEYDGWLLPRDYGDLPSEIKALQGHCAVFDLSSFGRIRIKGPDAASLMKIAGFASCDPPSTDGQWTWITLSPSGQTIRCRYGRINSEGLLLTFPGQDQSLITQLQHIADENFLNVTIDDLSGTMAMLGLYGPAAVASVLPVFPFDLPDLEPGSIHRVSILMFNLTILRGSWTGTDGLELLCPSAAGPMAAGAIAKYRQRQNITPAGMDCLKQVLISR